jgi:hypothetical protein
MRLPCNIYAVDVNNDGLSDIIEDSAQPPYGFYVLPNQGDGFISATQANMAPPGSYTGPMPIATGDFNNDGKVDIAVVLPGSNQIALYLNAGNGDFQGPVLTTIALPSGWVFQTGGVVAADFNHDGCDDLAAWTSNGSSGDSSAAAVYTLEGNCAGGFSNPQQALAEPVFQPNFQLLAGDFDSDGHADLLATTYTLDSKGMVNNTTVWILYGNGNFGFDNTSAYSTSSPFLVGTGDLNSDGRTDFFAISGTDPSSQQLGVFYGNTDRTFSSYFQNLNNSYLTGAHPDGNSSISQLTLADFNGDGLMDLAASGFNSGQTEAYTEFFLATSDPGQFTQQNLALPTYYTWETVPVAGLFGGSYFLPDVMLNQSNNGGASPQNSPSFFTSDINQATSGWFGNCTYPHSGEGFNVCNPGVADSSQNLFSANVNSFGKLRKIELWVDGVKVQEQHHTWDQHGYFDWAGTFAAGPHAATFYAADVDNRLQNYSFTFTAGSGSGSSGSGGSGGSGSCPAPSSPSVNVCSPANNSTVSSPVQATATANIGGETPDRMEIWVDGVKQYTQPTSTSINIFLPLNHGTHKIDFYAVSTSGGEWETTSYATVPASGSTGSTQYEAPLLNDGQLDVDGQIQIDTVGNTSIQLGEALPNAAYTVQFCPAFEVAFYYPGIPCFNVTTITTNSNGIAAATVKFPQAGNWAGDFFVNNSSGPTAFQTGLSRAANQNYIGTLLPQTKTNKGEVTTDPNQDPLTSGTVTFGNNQLTFTVNGAEPDATYICGFAASIYVDSGIGFNTFNTDASGDASTTTSLPGIGGDMFQLAPGMGNYAGFIAGFTIPQ